MNDSVKKSAPVARCIKAAAAFFKRHKIFTAILVVLLIAAAIAVVRFGRMRAAVGNAGGSYSFIRTTTLSKGTLDETVSTTGSVESADTSTVSYSAGIGSNVKIKTIHVAVGDQVEAGDVIITLDNTSILESIAKAEESLTEQKIAAQESYNDAVTARDEAYNTSVSYESTVAAAKTAMENAAAAFYVAENSVSAAQADYNAKLADMQTKGAAYNNAAAQHSAAKSVYHSALTSYDESSAALTTAQEKLQNAQSAAAAEPENADLAAAVITEQTNFDATVADHDRKQADLTQAETQMQSAQQAEHVAADAYTAAAAAADSALQLLNEQKKICGYDDLQKTYQSAQQTYNTARTTLNNYEKQYEAACNQLEQAADKLEDASTSDTLVDLYEQLEACELTAETSGKVTSLNATVGSAPNGTIATIQNTDNLKISITIQEADINTVQIGMRCVITSDATEKEINGVLSQMDPVAGQNGSFGAEVTVSDMNTGLLIGMNATVKIIVSSTDNIFMVPLDAVGNDDDGKGDYVYRKTGGEGVELTFEKVYVSVGESNDYYVEISGIDLSEGNVIRSSADLTQGLETIESNDEEGFGMVGGFMSAFGAGAATQGGFGPTGGNNMPEGNFDGNMPSGGSGGGKRPSGGPGGNRG